MSQRYAAALMRYAMIRGLARQQQSLKAALAGQRAGVLSRKDGDQYVQMTETRIYVGLNDAASRVQLYDTETYLGILKDVCRSYRAAFSVDIEEGGYYHEDGEYTEGCTHE